MTKQEAQKRIEKLKNEISHHRYLYHVLDKQEISEAALDSLKHELFQLEQQYPELITPDSPTQRVGGEPLKKFQKVVHRTPMLSMEDVFSLQELEDWFKRIQKILPDSHHTSFSFSCMPKLDGLAMSLIYEKGILKTAATRGNGRIGENVTQNIRTIESIPLKFRVPTKTELQNIQKLFSFSQKTLEQMEHPTGIWEIRGEIFMPKKAFVKLNKDQEKKGLPIFANPRNVAAGSIRQLDPKVTSSRPLEFFAWNLETDLGQRSHQAGMEILRLLGFKLSPGEYKKRFEQISDVYYELEKKREQLNMWIDGMVIRVNEREVFDALGVVGKTPRALVAWKFVAEEATTVVKEIKWFVGRTGVLTPVALFEPIRLAGTTVQKASLHNFDEIKRLDIRVGDTVILYKAGDIIPKVKQVLKNLRPLQTNSLQVPKQCPVCNSPVKQIRKEVALICSNKKCFAQERERILYALRAFDIDGLGPQLIAKFLDMYKIQSAPDLFGLKPEDLLDLEGFAQVLANKLVKEIQTKKQISLTKFLVALGIKHVGEETARDIAEHFQTIENIQQAQIEDFSFVHGVGEIVAKSLKEFFEEKEHLNLIKAYQAKGIRIVSSTKTHDNQQFAKKSFVITGTLGTFSREQAKEKIRALGGTVHSSVSKKTDYVVVGENPGSKFEEAKKLGVKTLSESEFVAMISKE